MTHYLLHIAIESLGEVKIEESPDIGGYGIVVHNKA
jgi:hypothetical protein